MPEKNDTDLKKLHTRANLPRYVRIGALGILSVCILAVAVGFIREKNRAAFRLKPEHTQLSKDVVAEVNGYERLETDANVPKYLVKADHATTFSDNHQELENVSFQLYDGAGNESDKMDSSKALYVPEENKNFTAYLTGSVNIHTHDGLNVRTEQITYTKSADTAEAPDVVEFDRENVRGRSLGAVVHLAAKKLELLKDVAIDTFESPELAKSNVKEATIRSSRAAFDQINERIELTDDVDVHVVSKNKTSGSPRNINIKAARAVAGFDRPEGKGPVLKQIELFDNVTIETAEENSKPTNIESGYALYDKFADRFDLKNSVHIVTIQDDKPTDIRANEAVYAQTSGQIDLKGQAEITQGTDLIRGDAITAQLNSGKKLKNAASKGNAFLSQTVADRTTQLASPELNATFDDNQLLTVANSVGSSTVTITPQNPVDYSTVTMLAPKAIHLWFKGEGLIDRMQTDGRTSIKLSVPDSNTDAANKTVTADSVRTFFAADGKFIEKAEAVGNAELFVEPLHSSAENYKTTINSPRFDCDFFPGANNARTCVAGVKAKVFRVPTIADNTRGTQTLVSDKMTAGFSAQTKDVERIDAIGNAKFSELDRNGISSQIGFTSSDGVVRLRGGEPTVWDSKARAKAKEIDWDTHNQKSYLRGGVSTTYYSQEKTGGATPFGDSQKPVFLTANSAEFDHASETGHYTGNARGWQENNYIRADSFLIDQRAGTFDGAGNVQSMLFNAKRKDNGKESEIPVYAAANKMSYNRATRVVKYDENVDVRQGTDRIVSGTASVYLNEKNEATQTIAERNVVITQPGRRATGEFAQYNVVEDNVVLRGSPATVDDRENGSSQSSQLVVYLSDHRVVADGKTKQNSSGRIRSVYKVKNLP
ncbi:MAG: LPS export ABC transporter periplasmic protein LptC [Acidobacteriota bacterium]